MNKPKEKTLADYERETLELFARARVYIGVKGPYFMRIIHTLVPVSVPGMAEFAGGAIAVSKELLLFYDPIRIMEDPELSRLEEVQLPLPHGGMSPKQKLPLIMAGVLVHEAQHVLRDIGRLEGMAAINRDLTNIAADLPINADIRKAGWKLPTWVVYPEKYDLPEGETTEWYFQQLLKKQEEVMKNTKLGVGAGRCGSVASGTGDAAANTKAQEALNKLQQGRSDKLGRDAAEVLNAQRSTAREAHKHMSSRGENIPPWVEQNIDRKKERPERNWEKELAHVTRRTAGLITAGGADFSLARPSKRSLIMGIPRPGLVDQKINVDIVWDTSASMSTRDLQKCQAVSIEVLSQLGIDAARMAFCDQDITMDFKRVRLRELPQLQAVGRRGTDFHPAIAAAQRLKPRPDVLMIITDGGGPAPKRPPPGIAVIWVIVPSRFAMRPTTWGHYVICSNDYNVVDAL